MSSSIGELMQTTMDKVREMMDVNTIVGNPITTPDGVTLVPVSKVDMGFGSGGSDFSVKGSATPNAFGGGSGVGIKITPVAFIVVKDGSVRIMPVSPPASNSVDRIIEMVPDVLEKVEAFLDKRKADKEDTLA